MNFYSSTVTYSKLLQLLSINLSMQIQLVSLCKSEFSHSQGQDHDIQSGVMNFSEATSAFSPNLLYSLKREGSLDIHSQT